VTGRPSLRLLPPELPRPATATYAGILDPTAHDQHVRLARPPVDPRLADWVENYWAVAWDLPAGASYRSEVVAHPAVNLTVEDGSHPRHGHPIPAAVLQGVVTGSFVLDLRGWGRVFGVKFRPGGFGAFTGRDVASWTGRSVSAVDPSEEPVLPDAAGLRDRVLAEDDDDRRAALVDAHLLAHAPGHDPRYEEVLTLVRWMLADPGVVGVEQVAERAGLSVRTLQRLFRRYVGVGPKWLVQRYRLHDAITAIDAGEVGPGGLGDLAARLGWYDQAHFTRDFTALVGRSPATYAAGTATRLSAGRSRAGRPDRRP